MIIERSFLSEQNKTFISYTSQATKVVYENNYIHKNQICQIFIKTFVVGAHKRSGDSNEHSQHRFYEEKCKIIFELSSNIIKYTPYIFWYTNNFLYKRFSV